MTFPRSRRLPLALLSLGLAAACTDLPTGADAFQLEADGQVWVAVVPPADLPDAASWLEYSPEGADPFGLRQEVAALQAEARRARVVGDPERADQLLGEAMHLAVDAMTADPDVEVFRRGTQALASWRRSVQAGVELERTPALRATVEAVARDAEAVDAAVGEGDFRRAATRLTEAGERVRRWSPDGVALQVLERVEAHLAAAARSPQEMERTAHLMTGAREELVGGDPLRAMQRALYALQLAGGSELREIPVEERSRCGEYDC
jgi:hypothetical protein